MKDIHNLRGVQVSRLSCVPAFLLSSLSSLMYVAAHRGLSLSSPGPIFLTSSRKADVPRLAPQHSRVLQSLRPTPSSPPCHAALLLAVYLASPHDALFFFPGSPDTNTWSRPLPTTRTRLSSPRSCSSSRPSSSLACLIPTHLSQIRAPCLHPTGAGTHARRGRLHTAPLFMLLCSRLSVRSMASTRKPLCCVRRTQGPPGQALTQETPIEPP